MKDKILDWILVICLGVMGLFGCACIVYGSILAIQLCHDIKPQHPYHIHDTTTVNIVERPAGMRIEGTIYYDIDGKWFSKDTVIYLKK